MKTPDQNPNQDRLGTHPPMKLRNVGRAFAVLGVMAVGFATCAAFPLVGIPVATTAGITCLLRKKDSPALRIGFMACLTGLAMTFPVAAPFVGLMVAGNYAKHYGWEGVVERVSSDISLVVGSARTASRAFLRDAATLKGDIARRGFKVAVYHAAEVSSNRFRRSIGDAFNKFGKSHKQGPAPGASRPRNDNGGPRNGGP